MGRHASVEQTLSEWECKQRAFPRYYRPPCEEHTHIYPEDVQKMYCSTLHRKRRMSFFSWARTVNSRVSLSLSLKSARRAAIHQTLNSYNTAKERKCNVMYDPLSDHFLKTKPHPAEAVLFCSLSVQQMCPRCTPKNLDQDSNRLKRLSNFVSQIHTVHNWRSTTANTTTIGRANRPRRSYQ